MTTTPRATPNKARSIADEDDTEGHTCQDAVNSLEEDDPELDAALAALVAAARRSAVARRLQGDIETRLLQSIVDATVPLFDAEAASIALFEQDPDRLEFRVAAGEQGAGAIGLSVHADAGHRRLRLLDRPGARAVGRRQRPTLRP